MPSAPPAPTLWEAPPHAASGTETTSVRGIARTSAAVLRAQGLRVGLLHLVCLLPLDLARAWWAPTPLSHGDLALAALGPFLGWPPLLGATVLIARMLRGEEPGGFVRLAADGFSRCGRYFLAALTYSNRVAVGLVLGVLPGLVWLVGGRFLAQVVALRPDVEPFAGSWALVRGDWPRQALLALGRFVCVTVAGALGELSVGVPGLPALFAAVALTVWSVVDTVTFLERERIVRGARGSTQ